MKKNTTHTKRGKLYRTAQTIKINHRFKKKWICFIFLYLSILFYAQNGSGSGASGFLETIITPSANAFSFANYGNHQPTLFTGATNFNIPITDFTAGSLKLPISLGYYSSGVKVDAVDNTVGQTWTLLAGGIISRTIVGEDDFAFANDLPSGFHGVADTELKDYLYNKYFANGYNAFNTEYDIFSFNLMGRSGRFYYMKSSNKFIAEEGSDLEINMTGGEFQIIDEKGTRYSFESNGIEETKYFASSCENKNSMTGYNGPMSENVKTAWFLTKITNINGNEIFLEYEDYNYGYFPFVTQRIKKPYSQMESYCGSGEGLFLDFTTEYDELCQSRQVNYSKIISRIYSNDQTDGEIKFNYERHNLSAIFYKYLTNISKRIKRPDNTYQNIDLYNFNYLTTTTRKFLESVANPLKNENYLFEYNEPSELPERLSFSQDLWGYYNGKTNGFFVPKVEGYKKFGNRDADPAYSKIGSLKKIIYPTKGRTEIDYEQNSYWGEKKYIEPNPNVNFDINYQSPESQVTVSRYKYQKTLNFAEIDPLTKIIFSISSDYLPNVNCPNLPIGQDPQNPNRHKIIISLIDETTGGHINITGKKIPYEILTPDIIIFEGEGDWIHTNPEDDSSSRILPNRNYILEVVAPNCLRLDFEMQTWKPIYNEENIPTGGLRIKRLTDIAESNELTKTYYYNKYSNKEVSSGDIGEDEPRFLTQSETRVYCPNGQGATFPECRYASQVLNLVSSTSRDALYDTAGGNNIYYPFVTISYGGDNREKGYSEHEFIVNRNALINQIHGNYDIEGYKSSNTGWNNGKEITTTFYNSSGDILKKTENQYQKEQKQPLTLKNLYIRQNYAQKCRWLEEGYLNNMGLGYYFTQIYRTILSRSTTTEYVNNQPTFVLSTEYFYNNPSHYQLTDQKNIFPDGSSHLTNYKYAHEKSNQKMIDANMIGIPLITETAKTANNVTKTISKTETFYPDTLPDSQTGNLLLPKSSSSLDLLTGGMSNEVTYDQYDSKGNLLQYTTKSGMSTAIVWGYNNSQPIAKIEGATYSQVSSLASAIISASDTDASAGVNNDESSFLGIMKTFRESLTNYQVTTYTYDPLVGVRSITPPNGIRQVYTYDTSNRLKEVREQNETGSLLKEYEYHYKP